jgi:hypothetical protein
MKLSFTFLFLLILSPLNAQVGGASVYEFLNLPSSARQVALGGETLTLVDDVNQAIWNPSIISTELDNKISVNYSNYLAGISLGSVSFSKVISRRFGAIHGSVKYLNYGTLIGADAQGNETGNFTASDLAISMGYARNIPNSNFFIGANLKLINANIDQFSSIGIASDISVLYNSSFQPFAISLVARNFGTQLTSFDGTKEKLPFKIALGASYQLEYVPLKWHITLNDLQQWDLSVPNSSNQSIDLSGTITNEEISFLGNAMRHVVVGAELFPNNAFNVRVGYNFKRAKELELQNIRSFSGISFGFGLKMNKLKFNYAYSKVHSASNVSTFSLEIDLDR